MSNNRGSLREKLLAANSDQARVQYSLKNLEKMALAEEFINVLYNENGKKSEHVMQAIATYKDYLTSPLPQAESKQEVIQQNQQAYANAGIQKNVRQEVDPKHSKMMARLASISTLSEPRAQCDAMLQLLYKNQEFITSYGPKAAEVYLYKLQNEAERAACDDSNPNREQYADIAKQLNQIYNSTQPATEKLKSAAEMLERSNLNMPIKVRLCTGVRVLQCELDSVILRFLCEHGDI